MDNTERLKELYKKYNLNREIDIFKHKTLGYIILTRQGIEKIQALEKIYITYDVIKCETNFSVMKAKASKGDAKVETFGSAVLKLTGFYELGVFGEDEAEDFKKPITIKNN